MIVGKFFLRREAFSIREISTRDGLVRKGLLKELLALLMQSILQPVEDDERIETTADDLATTGMWSALLLTFYRRADFL